METLITYKVSIVLPPFMATDTDTSLRILVAARQLVMQYGVRSVSMDDIAAHLGMSKKTIYQYYTDKDELVEGIVAAVISENEHCCNTDREAAENAVHEIILAMDMVAELFATMNPSLLFDLKKYHPTSFSKVQAHKSDYIFKVMRQNLVWGIKEKLYRSEIDIDTMALFRVESMFIPFNPDFQKKLDASLLKIELQLITHYLYGLVTPKGYEMVTKYIKLKKSKVRV